MLSRILSSSIRNCIVRRIPIRHIRTTVGIFGGGHDHHQPIPTHIPVPGTWTRTIFGEMKVPSQHKDEPYRPTKDCYQSYIGAAVGVLLTILAVTYCSDLFGKNTLKRGGHKTKESDEGHAGHHKEEKHTEEKKPHSEKGASPPPPAPKPVAPAAAAASASATAHKENKDSEEKGEKKEEVVSSKSAPVQERESPKEGKPAPVKESHVDKETSTVKESHKKEETPAKEHKEKKAEPTKDSHKEEKEETPSKKSHEEKKPDKEHHKAEKPTPSKEAHKEKQQEPSKELHKEEKKETADTKKQSSSQKSEDQHTTAASPDSEGEQEGKVPESVEYILIGSGTSAYYAALAIRAKHADAKVLMIGEEGHLPYNRPPLSKELWWYGQGDTSQSLEYKSLSGKKTDIFFESEGFFVPSHELPSTLHGGVSILKGRKVAKLCVDDGIVQLDDGTNISFKKALIATGGTPKTLDEFNKAGDEVNKRIIYLRGVDDYRRLENICQKASSITVVGGGFLGSELAYSIKRKYDNINVKQIVAEKGNLSHVLPESMSSNVTKSMQTMGIDVQTQTKVVGASVSGEKINVELSNDKSINSDYVIVAVGIQPETYVAEASGLKLDDKNGGVEADSHLQAAPNVFVAGDTCSFMDTKLGRRRLEHVEAAQISGRLAGENMTGANKEFWYQPSFFTKVSPQTHITGVGRTDSSLPTVTVLAEKSEDNSVERGVVFYKGDNNQVVGVLLLNVFGPSVDVSRKLIDEARPVTDFRQLAKLYPLYPIKEEAEKDNIQSSPKTDS